MGMFFGSGPIRRKLQHADVARARELREPLRDLVVQRQSALLLEQQKRCCSELFADGPDGVAHRRGCRGLRSDASVAIGALVHDLSAADDRDRGARRARRVEDRKRTIVDLSAFGRVELLRVGACAEVRAPNSL